MRPSEQRQESRVEIDLPAQISVGSQLVLQGRLKDISLKSAFIIMKSSVYLKVNDEVGFAVQRVAGDKDNFIQGMACVSRIAVGDGMAVYFTRMDERSTGRLKALLKQ
jgi:hypothetical protein